MKNKISIFTLAAMSAASVLNAADYYYSLDGYYYGTTETEGAEKITAESTVSSKYTINDSSGTTLTKFTNTYGETQDYNAIDLDLKTTVGGGALLIQQNLTTLTGVFIDCSAAATNGGGAVFSSPATSDTVITAAFLKNSATNGSGGAYYNNGGTLTLAGVFIANTAASNGGAIYNVAKGTTNITTSDTYGDTVFSGNTANDVSNAIYNLGAMNFSSTGDYKVIVNDGISGTTDGSTTGLLNIISGTTVFNNTVSNQTITVSSGATLELGSTTVTGDPYSANLSASALTVDGTLSLVASEESTITLGSVTMNAGSVLALDLSDIYGAFDLTVVSGSDLAVDSLYLILGNGESVLAVYDDEDSSYTATSLTDSAYSATYTINTSGTTYTISGIATAAVPEPSTYAMIFGVVALGFAAYRRRK